MQFLLGEKKEVRIGVISTKKDPFTIASASFDLKLNGQIETQGVAEIVEHEVFALIQPKNKGIYHLTFTYHIANEILKYSDVVEVR